MRLILTLAALMSIAGMARAADTESYPHGQLPGDVTPTHYAIDLTVVPKEQTFSGKTVIDITLEKPTSLIWLHGRELKVSEAKVIDASGAAIPATWSEIPGSDGVVKLTLSKPASGPKAQIAVTYTAAFNRHLEGLYRADEAGEAYIYSQMEPFDARRAFPGFDEPRFKTPYDVTLTVPAADAAVTNTRAAKEQKAANGMKRITFATTKPLPTYLIAIAVGPFDVVEWEPVPKTAIRDRVIPLRGITVKGKGPLIKYALAHTAGLLTTLESYFGIPYPYEKLDLIAALDFSAGAMENAGAIVYREPLMLFDDNAPLATKRRYALVHAHEMSHQWFGDLVTPAWWNDIWLNEAFATWMEHKTTDTWDPKGEYGRLGLEESLSAMTLDAKRSARRIAQPIESMDDIQNAFDGITYDKGNGVLAMFEHYYGVEGFRKGVQLHLKRHAFGTATSADFFQSIADANNDTKGVAAFQTFLNQAGVPMVEAELHCAGGGATVDVKQSRYVEAGDNPAGTENQAWQIPMCVAYGDAKGRAETCGLVEGRSSALKLKTNTCPSWIMPNADGAGYFRFSLKKKDWDALLAARDQLNDREVLVVLETLEAAFVAGQMDIADYLDRTKAMLARKGGDMKFDAAGAPATRLAWVKDTLLPESARKSAEKLIMGIYSPAYAKLGLDGQAANSIDDTLLRPTVVSMVSLQGRDPKARADLAKRGAAYLGVGGDGKIHPEAVDPNLADTAVAVAVQDLGKPAVDAIASQLKSERDAIVRARLLGALTRTTDPTLAARVRDMLLTGNLRVNEVPILVNGAVREPANRAAGWAWFKTNFDAIKAKSPPGGRGSLVGIGASFCTPELRADYKQFFEKRVEALEGGPREFAEVQEGIDTCLALTAKQRAKAETYFAKN